MIRRALLGSLMATPLAAWLRLGSPPESSKATIDGSDAAVIYRKAFDWAEALRPADLERLAKAATIAVEDRHVDHLIREARPVLETIREAASIGRCRWKPEIISLRGSQGGKSSKPRRP